MLIAKVLMEGKQHGLQRNIAVTVIPESILQDLSQADVN